MFCPNCGNNCPDNVNTCPNCGGALVQPQQAPQQQAPYGQQPYGQQQAPYGQQPYGYNNAPVDNGSIGWGFLGFCVPLVGLILFLVWKDSKPLSAKKAGIGALIAVGVSMVSSILLSVLGAIVGAM